jgi:hypoxanthine phosphoribosyltransferase
MTAVPVLLDREQIAGHVARLGREIAADHPGGVVLVGVLKGAVIFLADLVRAVTGVEVKVDFIAISRYAPDSGRVRIVKDLEDDVTGADVVIVEDIVDTGLTVTYLRRYLEERGPRRVELCTLLDRTVRRIVPVDIRYQGLEVPDTFVLGYGLHFHERYRNLPSIREGRREVVSADPGAYVPELYGRGGA